MRSIKDLLLKKQVEDTIPDKPGSRLQKYKLTAKGKKYSDSLHKDTTN